MKAKTRRIAVIAVVLCCIRASASEPESIYSYLSTTDFPSVLPAAMIDSLREGITVEQLRTTLGRGYLSPVSGGGFIEWFFADGRVLVLSPTVSFSPTEPTTFKRQSGTIALQWRQGQPPQTITIKSK